MYSNNLRYTRLRLIDTVVRDKEAGRLVLVISIHRKERGSFELEVVGLGLDAADDSYCLLIDELDLSSPPLGNVNTRGSSFYVSRLPKRNDWRQGLRKENLVFIHRGRMHRFEFKSLDILRIPVYDKYPTYKESLKKGNAFSRTFSLDTDGSLWYKGRERVGKDVDGAPILDEKHQWLKEALEDALR